MSWKVKRTNPTAPRAPNVPVGVAFDDQGQLVIPRHDLPMPDGRSLRYDGALHIAGQTDSAAYHTPTASVWRQAFRRRRSLAHCSRVRFGIFARIRPGTKSPP
jgi:hypothetical protein